MDTIIATAKTTDEAVTKALIGLETTSDKLEYEIVDKGGTEPLGIGAEPVIIRARKKESTKDKAMGFPSQIFGIMNMQASITAVHDQEEQELPLNLEDEDIGTLVGKRGQTLDSLQYLVSLIMNKGTEGYLRVKLDTENYRERRKEILETLAKNIAHKVKGTKRSVSLEPMNPYGRGIIHAAPQDGKYATTRSEGEEPFHHVVIALKKEITSDGRKGRYDRDKGGRFERSDRSGRYRNNRRTSGNSTSQTDSDASTETATGEEG